MNKHRLLVIDDHPVIKEGLLVFLERFSDIEVVDTAENGLEGLEKIRQTDPDIVLLDLAMPKLDGVEAIRYYLREKPGIGVVIFTGYKSDVHVYQALEAGARGYVLKGNSLCQVVEAVREVRRGGVWISPELNQGIITSFLKRTAHKPDILDPFRSLSTREQQVFRLLAKGKSTEETAKSLFISPKTVAKHRVAIKKKLGINNVAEMANYASRIGLLELDQEALPLSSQR